MYRNKSQEFKDSNRERRSVELRLTSGFSMAAEIGLSSQYIERGAEFTGEAVAS